MSEKNQDNHPAARKKAEKAEAGPEKNHPGKENTGTARTSVNPSSDNIKTPVDARNAKTAEKDAKTQPSGINAGGRHTNSGAPVQTASEQRSWSKLALLALIVALIGTTIASYSYNQLRQTQKVIEKIAVRTKNLEDKINLRDKKIATLESTIENAAHGLDESTVRSMIAAAVSNAADQPTPDDSDIEAMIASKLKEQEPGQRLTSEQVQTLIDQRLINYEQNIAQADTAFSAQIETLRKSTDAANDAQTSLDQHGEQLRQALAAEAAALGDKLRHALNAPDSAVLSDTLNFASIAAQNGDYHMAARYLAQALSAYDSHHLNQAPYAAFKARIAEAKEALDELAEQRSSGAILAALGAKVASWPFRPGNTENEVTSAAQNQQNEDNGFVATMERAGKSILGRAFTVTRNDATGLAWINADKRLQGIIRENVRLDIAYARALAMLHDNEALKNAVVALEKRIVNYFDTRSDPVKTALAQLDQAARVDVEVPDIATLADAIKKAAGEQR